MREFRRIGTTFSSTLDRKLRLDTGGLFFRLSLSRVDFCNRGETRGDLKCEGKEPSESYKLTIEVIGVTRISMQSFTKPVGIGFKSDDLHRANRIR